MEKFKEPEAEVIDIV